MKVHAFCRTLPSAHHVFPVWRHLPDDLKGVYEFFPNSNMSCPKDWGQDDVVLVGNFMDVACAEGRRVIYVEHGAGQSYLGGNPKARSYYHGGEHPDNVIGYLGPRRDVIDAWGRPGFACGAPICDPYELFSTERVAAITFHWNGAPPNMVGVPEAGTAFDHYADRLLDIVAALQANDWTVLCHAHPRFPHLESFWRRNGLDVAYVGDVRTRAQLLIADNTSLMYEMMYLGRDVIGLNAPWFRRDVEHGLRFWSHAPKMQVDGPDELIDLIPELGSITERGTTLSDLSIPEYVYGRAMSDGHDGLRAATWITSFLSTI